VDWLDLLPAKPRKWVSSWRSYRRTMRSPDRLVLVREYLPAFASQPGPILWVGVRRYTRAYPALLERHGAICWTTDIDPRWVRWGRAGRHLTGDICRIDEAFDEATFQVILLNGVFGWGVDGPAAQARALEAMARVMTPGGWLLLGWNTHRMDDPLTGETLRRLFEPASLGALPAHQAIAGTTHVYDLLRLRRHDG